MSGKGSHFKRWEPQKVVDAVFKDRVGPAYEKFGLKVEGAAKKKLKKGHGVVTGTLRRSIHTATPGYNWRRDHITPSKSTPELGRSKARALVAYGRVSLQIGSGLRYALAVHQGHHDFEGYHYLTEALDEVRPELPQILEEFKDK